MGKRVQRHTGYGAGNATSPSAVNAPVTSPSSAGSATSPSTTHAQRARAHMRRAVAAVVTAALAALTALAIAGCSGSSGSGSGTLKVGVRADVMGFGYLNEQTGNYYGLEIDIANEMASRMGYANVEFSTVTPDDRKEKLLNGEIDCIVGCYSIAESRLKNFDFSPAYYNDSVILMVQNSSLVKKLSDLKGGTIGTMSGANTAPQLATKLYEESFTNGEVVTANDDNSYVTFDTWTLRQYPSYQELSDALEEGEVDAIALDGAIAKTYENDERSKLEDIEIDNQSYGVATQKDSELSAKVSETIQGMLDDGTIETLIDKWD